MKPDPVPPLEQVWLFIYGLPEGSKQEHILKVVSEPIGKLWMVHMDSMIAVWRRPH